jgi:hypothetical protein
MASVTAFQAVNAGSTPVDGSQKQPKIKGKFMGTDDRRDRTDTRGGARSRTSGDRVNSVRQQKREQKNDRRSGQDRRGDTQSGKK